jgi:hypothetical protein
MRFLRASRSPGAIRCCLTRNDRHFVNGLLPARISWFQPKSNFKLRHYPSGDWQRLSLWHDSDLLLVATHSSTRRLRASDCASNCSSSSGMCCLLRSSVGRGLSDVHFDAALCASAKHCSASTRPENGYDRMDARPGALYQSRACEPLPNALACRVPPCPSRALHSNWRPQCVSAWKFDPLSWGIGVQN